MQKKQDHKLFHPKDGYLLLWACLGWLASGPVFAAGSPIPFDGFTATNGAIAADCPLVSGVQAICNDGIADDGMLQREVIIPSGPNQGQYIQFILTEAGVTGDASAAAFSAERGNLLFSNEDFVKQNNRGDGLSSKNTIIESEFLDSDTEERFVNESIYNWGWAQNAQNPFNVIVQDISTVDYSLDPLNPVESFNLSADISVNAGTFNSAADVVISQAIDLSDAVSTGIQRYQYDKKAGGYNPAGRTLNGGLVAPGGTIVVEGSGEPLLPGGTNGGNIDWDPYATVAALWIGQILDADSDQADTTFGYTSFRELNPNPFGINQVLEETALVSFTNADAVNWPPPTTPFNFGGAFDPLPATIATPMAIVAPTATVAAPLPLQPTVTAGTGSSDTTTVPLPVPYDDWVVVNGVFTMAPCPAEAVCQTPMRNESGIFQRIVTVAGVDYVQTILTEENATGDPMAADFTSGSLGFKNETFVRYGDAVEGVASNLRIAQKDTNYTDGSQSRLSSTAGEFRYNTSVKTGWARGGALDPIVEVDQSILIDEPSYWQGSSIYNAFSMKRGETEADTSIDMLAVASTDNNFNLPIMFGSSIRSGAYQNTTQTLLDPELLPSVSGNIAWDPGDAIQATWVSGIYPTPNPGISYVRSTSYTNLSTGDRTESSVTDGDTGIVSGTYPTVDLNPESWLTSPFGDAPTYEDPFLPPL